MPLGCAPSGTECHSYLPARTVIWICLSLLLHPIANQLLRRADVEPPVGEDRANEIGQVPRRLPEIVRFYFAEAVAGVRLGGDEAKRLIAAHEEQSIRFNDRHARFVAGT